MDDDDDKYWTYSIYNAITILVCVEIGLCICIKESLLFIYIYIYIHLQLKVFLLMNYPPGCLGTDKNINVDGQIDNHKY